MTGLPAICRRSYVHDTIVTAFEDGILERFAATMKGQRSQTRREQLLAQRLGEMAPQADTHGMNRIRVHYVHLFRDIAFGRKRERIRGERRIRRAICEHTGERCHEGLGENRTAPRLLLRDAAQQ